MTTQREQFEAWALPMFNDNPTWRESGDCELAWQSWQAAQSQQDAVEPIATVWVTRGGYGMELSTHVAYVLPDGNHLLYATPPRNEAAMRAALDALLEADTLLEHEQDQANRAVAIAQLRAQLGEQG